MTRITALEIELERCAGAWRHADAADRPRLQHAYADVLAQLYAQGWNDLLEPHALLPDEHMPAVYFDHNPSARNGIWRPSPGAIPYGPGYATPDPSMRDRY